MARKHFLTILLLLIVSAPLFSLVQAVAINDAYLYYDFDYIGNLTVNDSTGNNEDGISSNLNTFTTFNKLPNFALYGDTTNSYYVTHNNVSSTYFGNNNTVSFWSYFPDYGSSTSYNLYHRRGASTVACSGQAVYADTFNTTHVELVIRNGASTATTCASNTGYWTVDTKVPVGSYKHLVFRYNSSSNVPDVFIDGVYSGSTFDSGSVVGAYMASTRFTYIGLVSLNTVASPTYLDEFVVYEGELTDSQVLQLYNSGYGYNPYSTDLPQQIASIAVIQSAFSSSVDIDFADYFLYETNASINFSYEAASYEVYNGFSANTGDFQVTFLNDTGMRLYGFSTEVATLPVTLSVCNANGCTNTTIYFAVTGYAYPSQIATVADIDITGSGSVTRTVADYFAGYTRRFFQYTSPDNTTLINVTNGFPDSNSCFDASFSGDVLTITGKNVDCSVTTRFIVDNTVVAAVGNDFTTSVTATSGTETGLTYWENVFSIFPSSDGLSTRTKTSIMFIVMLASVIMLYAASAKGWFSGAAVGYGSAILLTVELLFFTSLGYVPAWITIVIVIFAVVAGGAWLSRFMGSSSGGD